VHRFQRPAGKRIVFGADPDETRVWLTIASRVFLFTLAVALASIAIGTGLLGALANFVLVVLYFAGLGLAAIEGYTNDGLLLAVAVAVAPTAATVLAMGVARALAAVLSLPPNAVLMLQDRIGGLLFVAVGGALFAWILGAGSRRLIAFGGSGQVRGP